MAGRKPRVGPAVSEEVRIRRSYFDCRFGQLHVRTAFPSDGGFDEHTTLLCIHQSPHSGRMFRDFLPEIARDRSVYAPDLPGYGESDAPPAPPSVSDYAGAMADFVDAMRFRQIDLLGHRTGTLVASELAILRPEQVRRLLLVSVPIFTSREPLDAGARSQAPAEDGSHLLSEWRLMLERRDSGMTVEQAAEHFADQQHNGPNGWWALAAAQQYAAVERLPLLRQPTLVLRTRDEFWDATLHVRQLIRAVRVVDLPEVARAPFALAPALLARHAREFLNAR